MTKDPTLEGADLAHAIQIAKAILRDPQRFNVGSFDDLVAAITAQRAAAPCEYGPDHLHIPPEAAGILRTTTQNLAQLRFRGCGPKFIKRGRKVLYRHCDLIAYLDENTRTSTGGA